MLSEREYRDEVRSIAEEAVSEARSGAFGSGEEAREAFSERLWETLDGHCFVIYTAKAQAVLCHSDNDGAAVEQYGGDGLVKDGALNWSLMAYCAMEADVTEALDRVDGFDMSDPCPE